MASERNRKEIIPGAALLAVGIAFIISYVVGKKMLAKEMEAEEKNLITLLRI